MLAFPKRVPQATYRLQFNSEFTFDHALKLAPYLKKLGISDLYASPIFQASSKSTHGYDVNDFNQISIDLGGRDGFDRLGTALKSLELGLLLDFVPNHMGIDGTHNQWWFHVLENGAKSKYASYFDIEWHPRLDRLTNRVLVPMLGDYYGVILEKGELSIQYEEGRFGLKYGSRTFPICPETYSMILTRAGLSPDAGNARALRLREWGKAFEGLPSYGPEEYDTRLTSLTRSFASAVSADREMYQIIQAALKSINGSPGSAPSFEYLHDIVERQHYRLAHWKVGAHEVNYRRFFAVDTLIGLKMEDAAVFDAAHALLADLIKVGALSGIRLDHIDGLWNPSEYLIRLKNLVGSLSGGETTYTLVEKILAPGEDLPESWAVHGTTGYEFAASLIEVFLDRSDEPAWTQIYEDFVGDTGTSGDQTYRDKTFILEEMFPNAIANLAADLDSLIEWDWRWRDISLHDLKTALRHLVACLSVYRTYRTPGEEMVQTEKDRVLRAVEEAIRRNPCVDPVPVRFIGRVVTGDYPAQDHSLDRRRSFERWVAKLQQVTGAIMAKSVEDTHFYRYVRLLGANEVGSHPSRFGQSVEAFHDANIRRQKLWPLCMLTTSTHDTKMSEDARARLLALAELPNDWTAKLQEWHEINANVRSQVADHMAPDMREEYLLYQALLAAWPLGMVEVDDEFAGRMKSYFRKAQGEAKLNTAWTYPHAQWHDAGDRYVEAILHSPSFLKSFLPFAQRIAKRGVVFSLAQTILKLTSPGVPDIYQGNEVWDYSLVDPDNRRSVDYAVREKLLTSLGGRTVADFMEHWEDGGIKMRITQALLQFRAEFPDLFFEGEYIPLRIQGPRSNDLVAFVRKLGLKELLVVVPRRLGKFQNSWRVLGWDNTAVSYSNARSFKNLFSGSLYETDGNPIPAAYLFSDLPFVVWATE